MRFWVWAIAVVILAGAVFLATDRPPPQPAVVAQTAAPAAPTAAPAAPTAAQPMLARGIHRFDDSYRRHRRQFQDVSDYSRRVRTNRFVAIVGFLMFVLMTLPKNARGAAAFYRQMMEKSPLPDEPDITDDNNRRARKVLFFYLLFLLYQIAQFPLTWGRDNAVQFFSDLAIQVVLLSAVVWTFHRLRRDMRAQWKADPDRRAKMNLWLGQKLEGLNIRWRDIQKLALGVFVAGFTPSLLTQLTPWLDALTRYGERVIGP